MAILSSILSTIALQVGTGVATQASATAQPVQQELSVWSLCLKGGYIMIPIALLALVCIYVFVERVLVLKAAAKEDATFMKRIKDYIIEGEIL